MRQVRVRVHETQRRGSDRVADARTKYALTGGGPAAVSAARAEICHGASGAIIRVVDGQVCGGKGQWTTGVLCAYALRTIVREACRVTEGVGAAERESAVVDAGVLDRVVDTERVVRVVIIIRVRKHRTAPAAVDRQRSQIVNEGIVLTAESKGTDRAAGQTDESLTAKLLAFFSQRAPIDVKPVLQLEDCRQPATQIFCSLEAPAGTIAVAA